MVLLIVLGVLIVMMVGVLVNEGEPDITNGEAVFLGDRMMEMHPQTFSDLPCVPVAD